MKNGRHFSGRLMAALLCVMLIATMIPVFASAEDLDPPKMKKLTNVEHGVKVYWYSVSGADGYRVFRKTSANGAWKAVGESTGTTFTDKTVTSGSTYIYAVRAMKSGKVKSKYSTKPKQITAYKAPKMKSATVKADGILVKWESVKGAPMYRVCRKEGSVSWKQIATTTSSQYKDLKVKDGKKYTYKVYVVTKANDKLSNYDHTPVSVMFSSVATIKSLKNRKSDVYVEWYEVKGANKYKLYRKTGAGDWICITTTNKLYYADTDVKNNLKYTYQVRAVDSSSKVIGTYHSGKSITYFVQPKATACVRSGEALVVTWQAVEGASNYVVFRKIGTGKWVKVGTTSETTYTDNSVPSGNKCYYTIAVADSSGSAISAYGDNPVGQTTYKDRPNLVSIRNGVGNIVLTWTELDTADKYRIIRKIGDNTTWVEAGTSTTTSFTDTNVENCKKYTYTVLAVDSSNTKEESQYDPTGLTITYYTAPALPTVTNDVSGVKVTWTKVDGVPNYKIWRKTGSKGWQAVATLHGADSNYTYIDKDVANNGHYVYSVSAVADSESAYRSAGKAITFHKAPTSVSTETKDGYIYVTWPRADGVDGYSVQRKVGSGSWTTVVSNTTNEYYKDTSVDSGKKYAYRVCTITSSEKSGYRESSKRTYLSKPVIKKIESESKGTVKVKWDEAVIGADKYIIYARTTGGSWHEVATVTKPANGGSVTIKNLTSKTYYDFRVKAVTGDFSSAYSDVIEDVSIK